MKLKKILATATVTSALGFGALGAGGAVASADPPWKPDHDDDGPSWQWQDNNGRGNPWQGKPWQGNPWQGDNWQGNNNWEVGNRDWWIGRPGKWWPDHELPPWGFWGPPPAYQWSGPPPWVHPRPINYWGHEVWPVWDDGFHGWGIWLFGIWIPIVGIGVW